MNWWIVGGLSVTGYFLYTRVIAPQAPGATVGGLGSPTINDTNVNGSGPTTQGQPTSTEIVAKDPSLRFGIRVPIADVLPPAVPPSVYNMKAVDVATQLQADTSALRLRNYYANRYSSGAYSANV